MHAALVGPPAGAASDVRAALARYYTAYYRDELGIPEWRELVAVRLDDRAYERARLGRLEQALGARVTGARLLNVGCGTGGLNVVAGTAGAEAWGVDESPEAVALARARTGSRMICAAAEALPLRSRSFDVVYCYSTLEHVSDPGAAIGEMLRVLRDGGALYLHTPDRRAWFESHYKMVWPAGLPRSVARTYLRLRGRPTAFLDRVRPLTARECRELLSRHGATVRTPPGATPRPVGGRLWPVLRLYYRARGIEPHVELIAVPRGATGGAP